MLKKEANKITGGLSAPGKMPEGSYNIPASACQTGQILAKVEGTPCSGCYALNRGRYRFKKTKNAMARRLASLTHPRWVEAMTTLVKKKKHFRWHDSGDIQSVAHLKKNKTKRKHTGAGYSNGRRLFLRSKNAERYERPARRPGQRIKSQC